MNTKISQQILKLTGAKKFKSADLVQSLWSGYGSILRVKLEGSKHKSVIAKHVSPPDHSNHPRGWNSNISHQRKLKSYEVEKHWYENWAFKCGTAKVPNLIASESSGSEFLLIMEDLNTSGYPERITQIDKGSFEACIQWLANFHARFLNCKDDHLWESGTYWHLETRPDELQALSDFPLKNAASAIDQKLKNSPYQTFIHGDAKLANFCFSDNGSEVAAVDFQYVGHGCGMKDLAYFVGSCLYEEDCEAMESEILDMYFCELRKAVKIHQPDLDPDKIETDWRSLYHYAWADFHRFLKGWSPGHWKINSYSEKICRKVIDEINHA